MNNIHSRILDVISQQMGISEQKLKAGASKRLDHYFGADVLDIDEIIFELEEEFNVNLPDDPQELTINYLISLIQQELEDNNLIPPRKII